MNCTDWLIHWIVFLPMTLGKRLNAPLLIKGLLALINFTVWFAAIFIAAPVLALAVILDTTYEILKT